MSKLGFSVKHMTWVLLALILAIVGVIVFANIQLRSMLENNINQTNKLKADAMQSDENLSKAKTLELYANAHKSDIDKAASTVAESKTYQYQNQIINDITGYANTVGITILEFNFPKQISGTKQAAVPGLNSINVTVSLQNPIEYAKLIQFLQLIEQNLTKMQVTSINVSPDPNQAGYVTSPSIGLEVYIK